MPTGVASLGAPRTDSSREGARSLIDRSRRARAAGAAGLAPGAGDGAVARRAASRLGCTVSAGPSLYRRHRPRTFADVVGQEHVVRTLSHAVERGTVHHAYLFVGSRGTGKTSMAKILAACLNCDSSPAHPTISPCGVCESCVSIASATSLDVIEMDAASNNSVDDIRELREKVGFAPVSGRHKVYILDEAHMLSTQAWNAFLKTLEEPPPRTIFVLATTEAQKVLPTVVDRCHRFDFGRPTAEQVATVVRRVAGVESIELDDGAAALIARHATGSFRDALGTLEQLVTYVGEGAIEPADVLAVLGIADAEELFAAVDAVIARDPAAALRAAAVLAASGRDPGQMLRDLEVHGRELLTVQVLGDVPAELRVTPERDSRLAAQAASLAPTDAVRLLDLVSAALEATANGAQAQIQLEVVVIKASAPEFDPSTQALLARIERLEQRLAGAVTVSSPVAPSPATPAAPPAAAVPSAERGPDPQLEPEAIVLDPSEHGASVDARPEPEQTVAAAAPFTGGAAAEQALAVPQPAPAGAAAGVGVALEDIVSLWPAVVDITRGANALLAALLERARPIAVSERELTIAFPADAEFHKRKAEQEENRRATADALRNVTGASLALRYELHEAAVAPEASDSAEPTGLSEDELVRRFVEELDAQEIADPEEKTD